MLPWLIFVKQSFTCFGNLRPQSLDLCVTALDDMCKMYASRDISLLCLVLIHSGTLTDSKESWSIGQETNTSILDMFSSYQRQIGKAFEKREKSKHFRIVSGSRARKGEFRYLVSLQSRDSLCSYESAEPYHICGGAIVTRTGIFLSSSFAFKSHLVHFATINNLFGCYSRNWVLFLGVFLEFLGKTWIF